MVRDTSGSPGGEECQIHVQLFTAQNMCIYIKQLLLVRDYVNVPGKSVRAFLVYEYIVYRVSVVRSTSITCVLLRGFGCC